MRKRKGSVERLILRIYHSIFRKVFTNESITNLSNGQRRKIKKKLIKLKSSKQFDDFAEKFSKQLTQKGLFGQKGIWKKHFEAAKKSRFIALPLSYKEYEYKVMKNAIEHNFKMIKSIPNDIMKIFHRKYLSTLIEQVAKGSIGRGSFKAELLKHSNIKAEVIARTETAKLQTAILQSRATNIGSVVYYWLASKDKRTRPSHKAMNGVIVFWDQEKPILDKMQGHAGEFPNCRCSPQPILDENDLSKLNYDVYDYRTHKIIKLKKSELIEAIKNKKL